VFKVGTGVQVFKYLQCEWRNGSTDLDGVLSMSIYIQSRWRLVNVNL
jgi:hypothetical protein